MNILNFIIAVFSVIGIIRTVFANWMAQNRPIEGKKFHWTDGAFDFLFIVFATMLLYRTIYG